MEVNQFDITEVLFSHIDLVFSKLDIVRSNIFKGSALEGVLSSKKDVTDYLKDHEKPKSSSKLSSNMKKILAEHDVRIALISELCDYAIDWCRNADRLLRQLCNQSVELDIRWNYLFTIRFCQIFVAYNKILLFFNRFPLTRYVIQLGQYLDRPPRSSTSLEHAISFVKNCKTNPFKIITKDDLVVQIQLGQFVSQIGPFLIQILGPWPLLDWQDFVVFNRPPKQIADSTLPNMEHICTANIQLLSDTTFFFSMAYPNFINVHPQFKTLVKELLSERESVPLTRSLSIPIKDIVDISNNDERDQEKIDMKTINEYSEIKFKLTHIQRLNHMIILLKDIIQLSEYEPGYMPTVTNEIVSLAGYAFYEVNIMVADSPPVQPVIEMLDLLVRLLKIYIKYDRPIQRFFIFNVGTVDTNYLAQLHKQFSGDRFDWQVRLSSYIGNLLYDLQTGVDLAEFDKGFSFDFTPFMYTQGRVLHYFNFLKITNHIAYLQPIFEQFETIRFHMEFAQNPSRAFLSYCPIHTLWRHMSKLGDYVKQAPGGSHFLSAIVNLYSVFNLDVIPMSNLKYDVDIIFKSISSVRADLLGHFYKLLNDYLDGGSTMVKAVQQNRFDSSVFNNRDFIPDDQQFSHRYYEDDATFADPIWQMKELLARLPNSIEFDGKVVEICPYIARHITENMSQIMFKKLVPDAFRLDAKFAVATELLWPLYTMLNASFTNRMFIAKFEQASGIPGTNYLDLISRFKIDDETNSNTNNNNSKDNNNESNNNNGENQPLSKDGMSLSSPVFEQPKMIQCFENAIRDFLKAEWYETLFLPHSKRFENKGSGQYFSLNAFKALILNLGAFAGFHLDHILVLRASRAMKNIYGIYTAKQQEINTWFLDFRNSGQVWSKELERSEFGEVGREMIKLGVILKLRQMVREALEDSVEKTLPGFPDLVTSGYRRIVEHSGEKEDFLVEMMTSIPFFHFIKSTLKNFSLPKTSDPIQFFFFLAMLLGHSQWHKIIYFPENETMSNNVHLFPVALDAFINTFEMFSISSDSQIIGEGTEFFFKVLQQVILKVKNLPSVDRKTVNTFVILVDLFPRNIKSIEHGRTTISFPSSYVAEAYRLVEKNDDDDTQTGRSKRRGFKKGKR